MKKILIIILIILIGIIFYNPKEEDIEKPVINYYNVEIQGEVIRPGVYKVPEKTSYKKAINMAGVTKYSVYIDNNDYIIKNTSINVLKRTNNININTATKMELMSIPNIGEKKAIDIIKYRLNKKIKDYQELKKILKIKDNEKLLEIMCYTVIK